jgi:predicted RNase H-like HicB family nuclease
MRNYLAFIHKDADSDYTVTFPDFPGCVTAGSTLDEARAMAQEALPFHLEGLLEDGEALADPMLLEEALEVAPANRRAVAFLVEVPVEEPMIRINITAPKAALARIDRYAQAHGMSRSAFLIQSARQVMQKGA